MDIPNGTFGIAPGVSFLYCWQMIDKAKYMAGLNLNVAEMGSGGEIRGLSCRY